MSLVNESPNPCKPLTCGTCTLPAVVVYFGQTTVRFPTFFSVYLARRVTSHDMIVTVERMVPWQSIHHTNLSQLSKAEIPI